MQSGFKFSWVGYSEIDKYANQIYEKHFLESESLGDVKAINPSKLPKINLITFGFPCQDLSVAGKRKGLRGERSGLFFEAMRIIKSTTPEIFIFENVAGLLTNDTRKAFFEVLGEIADLRIYECEWQLLNTSWFLPQNRERVYFIGHLRGTGRPKVFPIGESDFTNDKSGEKRESGLRVVGLDSNYYKGADGKRTMIQIGVINKDAQGQRVYSPEGNSCQLTAQGGGCGAKTGLYDVSALTETRTEEAKRIRRKTKDRDFSPRREKELTPRKDGMSNNLTANFSPEHLIQISPCIRAEHHNTADVHFIENNKAIRRLTPLECERLQGFPDNWTEGISDTQRYKCLGNAVSVPVVKEVGRRLL